MNLELVFRDTNNVHSDYTLEYKLRDTRLAQSWYNMLVENFFNSQFPIEKTYCLKGWQQSWDSDYNRNLEFLCEELNKHIDVINNDMPNKGYDYIDLNFTVEGLKNKESQHLLLNKIHHHFELLIGQIWNPSKWYSLAEPATTFSIRMLNNYCHEIEAALEVLEYSQLPHLSIGLNGVNDQGEHFFEKKRHDITTKEYRDFSATGPAGAITLYYAQLGKHHKEAYQDNDSDIDADNISGIRYATGEMLIHFVELQDFRLNTDYKRWLLRNGFDRKDRSLALDHGIVADPIGDIDINELVKRNDLYKIRALEQGEVVHEVEYNYTWEDQLNWEKEHYN